MDKARQCNFMLDDRARRIVDAHMASKGLRRSDAINDLIVKGWRMEHVDEVDDAIIGPIRKAVLAAGEASVQDAEFLLRESEENVLAALDSVRLLSVMSLLELGALDDREAFLDLARRAERIMEEGL